MTLEISSNTGVSSGTGKKVADKINDTYLKLHGEEDGVQSYGRMVDLLLAVYRKNRFMPVYDTLHC